METHTREATAGELEPWETRHLHLCGASLTDYLTANDTEAPAFHRYQLRHAAGRLAADNVRSSSLVRKEGWPPSTHEYLWVLCIEMTLEEWLAFCISKVPRKLRNISFSESPGFVPSSSDFRRGPIPSAQHYGWMELDIAYTSAFP